MKIQDIAPESVTQVYSGQDEVCRCGCKGRYFEDARNIKRILAAAAKLEDSGAKVDWSDGLDQERIANVSHGNDHAYTVYFK